jgi:hypothetical protein
MTLSWAQPTLSPAIGWSQTTKSRTPRPESIGPGRIPAALPVRRQALIDVLVKARPRTSDPIHASVEDV